MELSRKDLLKAMASGAALAFLPAGARPQAAAPPREVTLDDLRAMAKVAGLEFSDSELQSVLSIVAGMRAEWAQLRPLVNDYSLFPSTAFSAPGARDIRDTRVDVRVGSPRVKRPQSDDDLAYMTLPELGHLLRTRQITSVELTTLYLRRLKQHDPKLLCVAALMERSALSEARQRDQESEAGQWRGPLHGIPYGLKDLFSTKGAPTQWGTAAFKGQRIAEDAAVVEKLREAGAVLVAKLTLGALAMNDRWYGGMTRNPWNPTEGSSGSSAGSASAVAAGLVPFAIGTETSGSIVSPCHQCRVTGLRPTFGSVSRRGAMALSWTLDKVGPICRTAEDTALVLAALLGRDMADAGSVARGFIYRAPRSLKGLKVGVLGEPDARVREFLGNQGAVLGKFTPPSFPRALFRIIGVEAATMFDEITRNGNLNQVTENDWPRIFREARFITAVEHQQAERARTKLIGDMMRAFEPFDVVLASDRATPLIYPTNLVGLPQLLIPMGANDRGAAISVSFLAQPFQEAKLIAVGQAVQRAFPVHRQMPPLS